MLYNLFEYLNETYNLPGAGVFQYISFRSAMALITSLIVSLLFGGKIINLIRKKQIGEEVRNLGLQGEEDKKGTPTMGGLIILSAIIIPTLLFAQLDNIYVIILLISTVWLGSIGFLDDYIKVYNYLAKFSYNFRTNLLAIAITFDFLMDAGGGGGTMTMTATVNSAVGGGASSFFFGRGNARHNRTAVGGPVRAATDEAQSAVADRPRIRPSAARSPAIRVPRPQRLEGDNVGRRWQ